LNCYLANVNYRFGENAFLPYSAARLWAYATANPGIGERWTLCEILWWREPISAVIKRMDAAPPDLLGLSLYVWSERYSFELARAVKRRWPECIVVAGGPQVPEKDTERWWPMAGGVSSLVDFVVVGEGERAFARVLGGCDERVLRDRLDSLNDVPSPYLSGVVDDLVTANAGVKWQALQETNRGCPYKCTFCDWGSATYDIVRRFSVRTAIEELEWFARNRIELLYNCDANFGMLEQDVEFTEALVDVARRTGYPRKFRAAYAKKINDRVFGVAKRIADAGLSKGATISFQSMNGDVLKNVRRLNPVQKSLAETFKRYADARVPTYTELIVGLPGETLTSFKRGVAELLSAGQHRGLAVYPCMALRNSSLSEPISRSVHGLETRTVRLLLLHGEPTDEPVAEEYELIIATASMPHSGWRETWTWAVIVQALHGGGLTDVLAHAVCKTTEDYVSFYDDLLSMARAMPSSVLGRALAWWDAALDEGLAGNEWPTVLPQFGRVQWPPEEAVFLMVATEAHRLWAELRLHTIHSWTPEEWQRQKEVVALPGDPEWAGHPARYAQEVVWYGRKGRTTRTSEPARSGEIS